MSSLSGQQINQTYKSLLKLSDSSTGVTSTFQAVEDGTGTDTGLKLSTNGLTGPNIFNLPRVSIRKVGSGIANSTTFAYATDEYDSIHCVPFYDFGLASFSSITYGLSAATSTSDVVNIAFYNSQYTDTHGLIPYQLIATGGTITTTGSTGLKITTLPSSLSFSGYGSGLYWMCMITTNVGATPTVKFKAARFTSQVYDFMRVFFGGYGTNGQENSYVNPGLGAPATSNTGTLAYWSGGTSTFPTEFTPAINGTTNWYQANQLMLGFQLLANR